MSNYIEYRDTVAFHPGYYIKEIIDDSGLTQEDFAKRLDTTPKNISKLVNGEQNLSREMALKLSRMLGTTVEYWLNFQKTYDMVLAEIDSESELQAEREVFDDLNYSYFAEHFGLPDSCKRVDEQIRSIREYLNVASLTVLRNRELTLASKKYISHKQSEQSVVNSNVMVQIAINEAIKTEAPKFNKKLFEKVAMDTANLTQKQDGFYREVQKSFHDAGVVLVMMPDLPSAGVDSATKKLGDKVMIMLNDSCTYSDTFWLTLYHEVGHALEGEFKMSFNNDEEDDALRYALDILVPTAEYTEFVSGKDYSELAIRVFADKIGRNPALVLRRLQRDRLVAYQSLLSKTLSQKYQIERVQVKK